MATSRRTQTSTRRTSNRRTAAKVTETPESSAPAPAETPEATSESPSPDVGESLEVNEPPIVSEQPEVSEPTDPISETALDSDFQEASTESTPKESIPEEPPMSNADVIEATATPAEGNGSAIEIRSDVPSLSIWNRPVMPSDIEIVGTITSSGERPIEASHLAVFGTILNGRPILASNLKVAEMLPGNRPIFYSDFHSVSALTLAGDRPVMASASGLMHAEKLPGDRPIFTNDVDDPSTLMGFID
ncbi:hypothetical protein Q2T42_27020 [Leptolyngbya boryana CZ1]|jgi:hypothetical protein|uniref:Uncharacterized protein n=2 Tax=Leptolyngbya boryana TaxID=1184 RepID=A0A1Z4JFW1_LEPBY|nr:MULTISPECIES: hypothetical protein [Leptolyngbya]BAY55664.1 hypothetical protein NIES2135_24880 [Leptolyngbya boryana NIES-2135]MBD1854662.1 hypothetical protein [Leptolyngbya sp. FACHB-1624]MBD2370023.1 hypothetical protein [Leptolyngbya sp. FACHB-161]MBD2376276.1 hypothetical protein [Leptolyngbya sp. FACHB-238]MBD2400551.1 hypothetical protein [Leptolyngbya sp. FACHB-239]